MIDKEKVDAEVETNEREQKRSLPRKKWNSLYQSQSWAYQPADQSSTWSNAIMQALPPLGLDHLLGVPPAGPAHHVRVLLPQLPPHRAAGFSWRPSLITSFCKFLFVLRFGATSFKSQALAQSFTWQVPKEFVVPQWGRTDGRRGKVEGERVEEEGKCKWSRYGRDGAAPWLHSSSHTSLLLVHLRLQLPHPTPSPPPSPPPMAPPCLAAQLSCRCSRAKTFETSFIRARNFLCGLAIFSSNWIKMVKIRLTQYEAIREIPF